VCLFTHLHLPKPDHIRALRRLLRQRLMDNTQATKTSLPVT
jgi:hypothetical protein